VVESDRGDRSFNGANESEMLSQSALLSLWAAEEQVFAAERYSGAETGPEAMSYPRGSRLALSAPHAVNVLRNGALKFADLGTGGLCVALAMACNVSSVVRSQTTDEPADWTGRDDQFARKLLGLLEGAEVVLDLHGMSDHHGVDICLGRGPAPSPEQDQLIDLFLKHLAGLRISVDEPFSGRPAHTIMSLLASRGQLGLQVEIAGRWRSPADQPESAASLITGLARIIRDLEAAGRGR
jgi:hypothetical protein